MLNYSAFIYVCRFAIQIIFCGTPIFANLFEIFDCFVKMDGAIECSIINALYSPEAFPFISQIIFRFTSKF